MINLGDVGRERGEAVKATTLYDEALNLYGDLENNGGVTRAPARLAGNAALKRYRRSGETPSVSICPYRVPAKAAHTHADAVENIVQVRNSHHDYSPIHPKFIAC
jgi:hypothetical protein